MAEDFQMHANGRPDRGGFSKFSQLKEESGRIFGTESQP